MHADMAALPEQPSGHLPLLPMQSWILRHLWPGMLNPNRWNLHNVLPLPAETDGACVSSAVELVWRTHDALRATFHRDGGSWWQRLADASAPAPFRSVDLSRLDPGLHREAVGRIIEQVDGSLHVTGPLVRFVHVRLGVREPSYLVIVAHHLVVDELSMSTLGSDLRAAIRRIGLGQPPSLPPAAPYQECLRALAAYAESDLLRDELADWLAQPWDDVVTLPGDAPEPDGATVRRWTSVPVVVAAQRLNGVFRARRAREEVDPASVTLAAVAEALTGWAGGAICVQVIRHCRNLVRGAERTDVFPPRVWRTVGPFATPCPVVVPARGQLDPVDYLRRVAGTMAAFPNQGAGLSLLRWARSPGPHSPAVERMWARSTCTFNYFGFVGADWPRPTTGPRPPADSIPAKHDLTEPRLPMHIRVALTDDELYVMLDHDPGVRGGSTIAGLARLVEEAFSRYAEALAPVGSASGPPG